MWFILALLSAIFAALTSILAKIGVEGVNSNLATAIRTVVVVIMAWGMVFYQCTKRNHGDQQTQLAVSDFIRFGNRCFVAVLLQGITIRGFRLLNLCFLIVMIT